MMPPRSSFSSRSSVYLERHADPAAGMIKESTPEKHVSFIHHVTVRRHIHLNEMTPEEVDQAYYNDSELSTMRAECVKIIKLLNSGLEKGKVKEENSDLCYRGLEFSTKVGSHLRAVHKYTAWDAVDYEQARQWKKHEEDSDELAHAYHECTEDSAALAHMLALRDHEIACDEECGTGTVCVTRKCSKYAELLLSFKKLDKEAVHHQEELHHEHLLHPL